MWRRRTWVGWQCIGGGQIGRRSPALDTSGSDWMGGQWLRSATIRPAPRHRGGDPESEHPPEQVAAELCNLLAHLRPQLGQPLLQLGVEAREVELVQLAKIGSVGQVHSVEPVHQLVGHVLAQDVIEALGSLAVTGTRCSAERVGDSLSIRSAPRGIKSPPHGPRRVGATRPSFESPPLTSRSGPSSTAYHPVRAKSRRPMPRSGCFSQPGHCCAEAGAGVLVVGFT